MQCEIASETGKFVIEDVARDVAGKLVRRHPHVFGDSQAGDSEAVLKQWEEIKHAEKGEPQRRLLDGLPGGLPSLMKAGKIQKKVEKVGFDWPSAGAVIPKIREELDEVEEVLREGTPGPDDAALGEELGDVLFAVTNLARKLGMESESLLAAANEKFIRRFDELETLLEEEGTNAAAAGMEEMEKAWQRAKAQVG
jgi:MazG family protein